MATAEFKVTSVTLKVSMLLFRVSRVFLSPKNDSVSKFEKLPCVDVLSVCVVAPNLNKSTFVKLTF